MDRDSYNVHPDEAPDLTQVRAACLELDATFRHVRSFATMMRDLRGDRLCAWIDAVPEEDLPHLHRLAHGLRFSLDAIVADLSVTPQQLTWRTSHLTDACHHQAS